MKVAARVRTQQEQLCPVFRLKDGRRKTES